MVEPRNRSRSAIRWIESLHPQPTASASPRISPILCNEKGELINFVLTRANADDRNEAVIDTLTDKVFGKLYADKGYISRSLFGHLWNDGVHIVTGLRSNMKQRLMPLYDKIMLRNRSIIESINDMLKNVARLVHSRHRDVHNFLMNMLAAMVMLISKYR